MKLHFYGLTILDESHHYCEHRSLYLDWQCDTQMHLEMLIIDYSL